MGLFERVLGVFGVWGAGCVFVGLYGLFWGVWCVYCDIVQLGVCSGLCSGSVCVGGTFCSAVTCGVPGVPAVPGCGDSPWGSGRTFGQNCPNGTMVGRATRPLRGGLSFSLLKRRSGKVSGQTSILTFLQNCKKVPAKLPEANRGEAREKAAAMFGADCGGWFSCLSVVYRRIYPYPRTTQKV